MSRFKVGDKVCVTPPDDWETGPSFVSEMWQWCGHPFVIQRVVHEGEHGCDGGWYTLVGGGSYYFAGDWMKKAVQFKGNK